MRVNCAAQSAIPSHKQALPSTGRPEHHYPFAVEIDWASHLPNSLRQGFNGPPWSAARAVVQGLGETLLQPWPATAKYAYGAHPALPQVNPWT